MPKRALFFAGAILLVLLGLNIRFWPNNSATSFGVDANGYKASYDLLSELGFHVARSYLRPSRTPANRTLWLVLPSFLYSNPHDGREEAQEYLAWVRSGGTAIVFGGPGSDWKRLGITRGVSPAAATALVTLVKGDFTRTALRLEVPGLLHFAPAKDHAEVRLTSDGAPFALELKLGAGRLLAIADGRFARNSALGMADASVLVVDLAREFGTPVFDEHCHGLATPVSIVAAVADSRAILPLAVALLAALLWVGEQRSWPRRTLGDEPDFPEPSIASFVESLGVLYSRTGDPGAVFRAYRSGFLHRMRRQLSAGFDLPDQTLLERIAHDGSLSAEARRWLVDGDVPGNNSELVTAVREIESYCGIRT